MNVEIEFLEWVHPRAGITKVQMEDGKPLVLKAKIKHEWVGLTDQDMNDPQTHNLDFILGARWAEEILKEKNETQTRRID